MSRQRAVGFSAMMVWRWKLISVLMILNPSADWGRWWSSFEKEAVKMAFLFLEVSLGVIFEEMDSRMKMEIGSYLLERL